MVELLLWVLRAVKSSQINVNNGGSEADPICQKCERAHSANGTMAIFWNNCDICRSTDKGIILLMLYKSGTSRKSFFALDVNSYRKCKSKILIKKKHSVQNRLAICNLETHKKCTRLKFWLVRVPWLSWWPNKRSLLSFALFEGHSRFFYRNPNTASRYTCKVYLRSIYL